MNDLVLERAREALDHAVGLGFTDEGIGGWQQSMSATGCCYDNAFTESCFASIKAELLPEVGSFDSHQQARRAIFDYIETFYNRRRKHSSLGYMAPARFLELYFKKQNHHLN